MSLCQASATSDNPICSFSRRNFLSLIGSFDRNEKMRANGAEILKGRKIIEGSVAKWFRITDDILVADLILPTNADTVDLMRIGLGSNPDALIAQELQLTDPS